VDAIVSDANDEPEVYSSPLAQFESGFREFSQGRYFEAHDIWEDLWHGLRGPDRRFLQGLIHLAVGAYHFECQNQPGAASQWGKATVKLNQYPAGHWGVDTRAWLEWIEQFRNRQTTATDLPKLSFERCRFPVALKIATG